MKRALAMIVVGGVALGACADGPPTPDLFVVERYGSTPGARLTLLVSDTTISCNGGQRKDLSSSQILTGRRLLEDLEEFEEDDTKPVIPRRGGQFTFAVRSEFGTVRFADRATKPDVLPRIARFTRTVAQDLCGLQR